MNDNSFDVWCELPTAFGIFRMYATNDSRFNLITYGDIHDLKNPVLLRAHSSCIASEIFKTLDCDCADQLHESMKLIARSNGGLIVYLNQEGRGQGLTNKIKAIHIMQDKNVDTVEAFDQLRLDQDVREYDLVVQILKTLKINDVRLISNNPLKGEYLEKAGVHIAERILLPSIVRPENRDYLESKIRKLDHNIQMG